MHWFGFILIVLGLAALAYGSWVEHDQRSTDGPVALAPTLPFAIAAALLAALGFGWLHLVRYAGVRWVHVPAAFFAMLVFGVWLTIAVGKRAERRRSRRRDG